MRLSSARVAVALAAPAGVLAGHAVGYLAGDAHSGGHAVDHAYLSGAAAVVGPLAVAALVWAGLSGARPGARSLPFGPLLAAQWALFFGQEMIEHALAGHGPLAALESPAVWLGLAAQVVVALALAVLLHAAGATAARALAFLARLLAPRTVAGGWARPAAWPAPSCLCRLRPASRGPPPLLA